MAVAIPVGTRFNGWTVVGDAVRPKAHLMIPCRCKCGTEKLVRLGHLQSGISKSCHCDKTHYSKIRTHGETHTPLHSCWAAMKKRCLNPDDASWANYGGRGITVCPEWEEFVAFRDWALASGYRKGLQIDRIDNDKGYCPENCRWSTAKENMNNRRVSVMVTAFGETKNPTDWASDPRCKVTAPGLYRRIQNGWDHHRAVTSPRYSQPPLHVRPPS